MADSSAAHVGDNAPKADDATTAGKLTAHDSMLKDIHGRLGAVEKHLGIKREPGVAKEEGKSRKRH
jgi:hypothetical protein